MTPQDKIDFLNAVQSLTSAQRLTLYNFSHNRIAGSRYTSGMDLLHETIDRVLSGSRTWNRSVPIGAFLHEAMRSVLSIDTRHPDRRPLSYEDWMEAGFDATRSETAEYGSTPEDLLERRQGADLRQEALNASKARLAHCGHAQAVFDGLSSCLTPAQIRQANGLTEKEYKAAHERIRRDLKVHGLGARR